MWKRSMLSQPDADTSKLNGIAWTGRPLTRSGTTNYWDETKIESRRNIQIMIAQNLKFKNLLALYQFQVLLETE